MSHITNELPRKYPPGEFVYRDYFTDQAIQHTVVLGGLECSDTSDENNPKAELTNISL